MQNVKLVTARHTHAHAHAHAHAHTLVGQKFRVKCCKNWFHPKKNFDSTNDHSSDNLHELVYPKFEVVSIGVLWFYFVLFRTMEYIPFVSYSNM